MILTELLEKQFRTDRAIQYKKVFFPVQTLEPEGMNLLVLLLGICLEMLKLFSDSLYSLDEQLRKGN